MVVILLLLLPGIRFFCRYNILHLQHAVYTYANYNDHYKKNSRCNSPRPIYNIYRPTDKPKPSSLRCDIILLLHGVDALYKVNGCIILLLLLLSLITITYLSNICTRHVHAVTIVSVHRACIRWVSAPVLYNCIRKHNNNIKHGDLY